MVIIHWASLNERSRMGECSTMGKEIRRWILNKFKQTERKNGQRSNDRTGTILKIFMKRPMQSEWTAPIENASQKTAGEIPYPIPQKSPVIPLNQQRRLLRNLCEKAVENGLVVGPGLQAPLESICLTSEEYARRRKNSL